MFMRHASFSLLLVPLLSVGCSGKDSGDSSSELDSDRLVSDLSGDEYEALCERTNAHWKALEGKRVGCELDGLLVTDGDSARRDVCVASRESCYDEVSAVEDSLEDSADERCGGIRGSWLHKPSCDVTVGELETCSQRRARFASSVSCEQPEKYSYRAYQASEECYDDIAARCED